MAARKPRKATVPVPAAKQCGPCNGTGEVARTVRVGRTKRPVGQQTGICLACFGTGEATD
ncbi:hypothetical protein [Streptomyces sp. Tue6028]|uniref:hypothetical protein n=1 Tax=Streptomyces sp. Tue6028 TaxID=2036037 RepID=UPI000BB2DD14|nr:hypothetical protein [Streptomyces sp. Tue6028]